MIYNGLRKVTATPRDMNATRENIVERAFDDLIDTLGPRPERHWRSLAKSWALRLAGNLMTGIAVGVGVAVGMAIAG
ncbi:MAG: hypothetical protein E5Y79_16175 [Mesorhizobium sp.]|uniref:hypothetical protein n=1 Tax=Mesorhizobium sp. TaxID=1871066 RepID=UPI001211028C|nr:hypothetical protein [Mesorhizobium sp.]TIL59271.1 MAG: hypothetical protein E5Y79_16175 [Mesorhizobium sp.]TIL84225.1 MAG: hypothetical protein E5Y73_34395 [Mesorhizobium sp.]